MCNIIKNTIFPSSASTISCGCVIKKHPQLNVGSNVWRQCVIHTQYYSLGPRPFIARDYKTISFDLKKPERSVRK